MESSVKTRRYDGSNRRRQAEENRRRILDAAAVLFVRHGYSATTMAAIAAEAGVAVQTVYASARTKPDILQEVLDIAVSGHAEPVAVVASKAWRNIRSATDPHEKLRLFARLHRQICEREAALIQVMAEAADPEIRALMHKTATRRYQDQHALAEHLRAHRCLDPTMATNRAADIIWTLASESTFLSLVRDRGWNGEDYESWLATQLASALIAESSHWSSARSTAPVGRS